MTVVNDVRKKEEEQRVVHKELESIQHRKRIKLANGKGIAMYLY